MAKAGSGRKSTELEYEEKMVRVFEVMLYHKKSYTEFKEQMSKEFGITQRAAENMWLDARTRLKERFSQEREEVLSEQLNRLYDLLNRCRESGNRRVESEVLRDINKIYGLDQPVKLDLTSGGEPISLNIVLDRE
jgi:tRNA A37 N6-isopentenylltransferase MiaA